MIDDRDPDFRDLEPQRTAVLQVRESTQGRIAFCTTFRPYAFEEPGFREGKAIRQLSDDFAQGAVAVKIYKVMGMEMKSKAGKWVMPDDAAFMPIYGDIASHQRTLIATSRMNPTPAGRRRIPRVPITLITKNIRANTLTHIPNGREKKRF